MFKVSTFDAILPEGLAAPDIGWTGFVGDFVPDAVFGFVGQNPIKTSILMLLFTDVACEPAQLRPEHNGDRRGWVGDGFGIDATRGEQPLGSTLWLLRRSVLNEQVAFEAEAECVRALQPLVRQGIATSVLATARINGARDRLELAITLKARDGRPVFADQFDVLWKRVN